MKQIPKAKGQMRMRRRLIIIAASASILALIVAFIFIFNIGNIRKVFAAGTTTYYSIASGSWTSTSTWSTRGYNGKAASSYPSAGDAVKIKGKDVTLTANASCKSITFDAYYIDGSLTISNGIALSVSGDVDMNINGSSQDEMLTLNGDSTTLDVGGDFNETMTSGSGGATATLNNASKLIVAGNITLLNNGGSKSLNLLVNDTSRVLVSGDVYMTQERGSSDGNIIFSDASRGTISGGLTLSQLNGSAADHFTVQDKAHVSIAKDLTMKQVKGSSKGYFTVQDSAQGSVSGDVNVSTQSNNNEFLTLDNTSQMSIGGNIIPTKNATNYTFLTSSDSSTMQFTGTSAQTALGNGSDTMVLGNLVVNNSQGIILNGPIKVTGLLTLTKGVVTTTAAAPLVMGPLAVATAGSDSSYVDGPMQKQGITAFSFPVGDNGTYAPIAVSASPSFSKYTAQYFDTAYASTTPYSPLQSISPFEYWNLNHDYGSSSPEVTLGWTDGGNSHIGRLSDLRVAWYDANNNVWKDGGNTATTGSSGSGNSGTIASNSMNHSGLYTFGSTVANALPVSLIAFQVQPGADGSVQAQWTTASEANNDYFLLQRSADAKTFEDVAKIKGNGTSQMRKDYSYLDKNPLPGQSYYRLEQVDYDGKIRFLPIKRVSISTASIENIGPNPFSNQFTLQYSLANAGPVEVQLINMMGAVSYEKNLEGERGINSFTYNDANLPQGTYILRVVKNGEAATTKIIKGLP